MSVSVRGMGETDHDRGDEAAGNRVRAARPFGPLAAWCFAAAGVGLLASVLVIDARVDLARARYERDRALAIEGVHAERLRRHAALLGALRSGDAGAVRAMRIHREGVLRSVTRPLGVPLAPPDAVLASALEPDPPELPPEPVANSALARLATGRGTRLWAGLAGAVALLIGLLPTGGPARADGGEPAGSGGAPNDGS